jgi:hypothetical protein
LLDSSRQTESGRSVAPVSATSSTGSAPTRDQKERRVVFS